LKQQNKFQPSINLKITLPKDFLRLIFFNKKKVDTIMFIGLAHTKETICIGEGFRHKILAQT
jgi:hypothetical protein